jgi:perosamine synthetase
MTRDRAMEEMTKIGLPTRPFFYPLSSLPAYPGREAQGRRDNPVAYDVSEHGINLPCALNLTEADLDAMSDGLHRILGYS